jgi:hypothetical protein
VLLLRVDFDFNLAGASFFLGNFDLLGRRFDGLRFSTHANMNMPVYLKRVNKSSIINGVHLIFLCSPFSLSYLHQLGHIEPVHVMDVWINPLCFLQVNMISLLDELNQSLLTHICFDIDYFHESLFEDKVDNFFILQRRYRTCGVHHCSSYSCAVNSC